MKVQMEFIGILEEFRKKNLKITLKKKVHLIFQITSRIKIKKAHFLKKKLKKKHNKKSLKAFFQLKKSFGWVFDRFMKIQYGS
jgi:hypothetical protein